MPVKVEGLNRVVRDLQKTGADVLDLKAVFSEIAAEGAHIAARFAPARSGKLKATIRGNKAKNRAQIIAGRAKVPYAGAINYGWKTGHAGKPRRGGGWPLGIAPAHFLAKADAELQERAPQMMEDGLSRIIEGNDLS